MREWSAAAAEMTAGQMVGDVNDEQLAPPDDTGETVGLLPSRPDDHLRHRAGRVRARRRGPLRPARRRPAALRPAPAAARRRARPGDERRRPLRPGLLRRPPGRLPRGPQPGPDRPRRCRHALVAARLRAHLDHQPRAGHPAQPDGLQGRDQQHPRRGHRGDAPLCLARRDREPGLDARRHLHGHPPDPDAARDLGPLLARDQEQTIGRRKYSGAPIGGAEEFDPLELEAERTASR